MNTKYSGEEFETRDWVNIRSSVFWREKALGFLKYIREIGLTLYKWSSEMFTSASRTLRVRNRTWRLFFKEEPRFVGFEGPVREDPIIAYGASWVKIDFINSTFPF